MNEEMQNRGSAEGIDKIVTQVPEDRPVYIHVGPKRDPLPPFMLVGRGGRSRYGMESINLVQAMAEMDKDEIRLFRLIEQTMDWKTNIALVPTGGMSKAERNSIYRGYKKLREKDYIRRVGNQKYMVNPRLIIPGHLNAEEVYADYISIKSERSKQCNETRK